MRSSRLQSSGGHPEGSTTQRGCGSKVTATGVIEPRAAARTHTLEQALMTDVNAVEAADRHHRPWAARVPRGELMEQFHRDVSRPAPWSAGAVRR